MGPRPATPGGPAAGPAPAAARHAGGAHRRYIAHGGGEARPDLVEQLAAHAGYFDQAHFSADFRKLVGESPAHYRKRARHATA
ncbi:helix-turn-helix domain-containing protein [Massilia sp. LXY-6]